MKDRELTYWTTDPNVFYIAVHESNEKKVLGIVGCKKTSDITVELARLTVIPEARYSFS